MAQTNTKTVRRKRKVRLLTRNGQYYDYNLLACVVLLTCFGLIMLYSTSAYDAQVEYGSDTYFLFRQALFSVGGLAAIFVFSMIDYHFYARYAGYFYLFSNLLLLVTKFIGHEVNGAKRWIKIGPIQFQSAEPAKLAIILFLSVLIVQFGKKLKGFKAPAVLFAFGALTFLLTWKFTENLSTAIIILVHYLCTDFCCTSKDCTVCSHSRHWSSCRYRRRAWICFFAWCKWKLPFQPCPCMDRSGKIFRWRRLSGTSGIIRYRLRRSVRQGSLATVLRKSSLSRKLRMI